MKSDLNNFKYLNSVAIFGGTFDPIHFGHLSIAEAVREELNVEKVFFMPNGNPPHKNKADLTNGKHRYLMAVLATLSNEYFDVLDIEVNKPTLSYTVDTLREIRSTCFPNSLIYLIIGADVLFDIFSWKEYNTLFSLCEIVVVARNGYNTDELLEFISLLNDNHNAKVTYLELPLNHISSTDIRERVQLDSSIKYLTPESVEDFICKNGLYKTVNKINTLDLASINTYLKDNLSEKRFNHTTGVAQMALSLANSYNLDENKAYLAGLLHDIAKEIPDEEKLKLCDEYGIKLDPIMKHQPELIHSFLSAELSKALFGVDDHDILNAISYHTTGRANMSDLEKIVYISDVIEPNRKSNETLAKIRKSAYNNLNKAMLLALNYKLKYTTSKKGEVVHPLSTDAINYYNNLQ